MLEEAIARVRAEIAGNANNPYVKVVGDFMVQHLTTNPQDAEKVLAQDKTIVKSLDAMRSAAEKKKVGNCAVLTDAEGFGVVLKYFGIDGLPVTPVTTIARAATPVPSGSDFDVKLDDFL
jgi:hypothetical protein